MPLLTSPIVSTQWLADHLGADDLLVVDASGVEYTLPNGRKGYLSGHEQYILEGHIPGAVFADLIDEFSAPDGAHPFTRPDGDRFAAAAGALGVSRDTTVVVYDSGVGQWASRLWWLLRSFGHDRVAVLDGGLTAWRHEGRDTVLGHIEPQPAGFEAVERPGFWVGKDEVVRVVRGELEAVLVCAAPAREFRGEVTGSRRPGHIPGSISVPASRLVDRETRRSLDEPGQRALLGPALDAQRVIVYCSSGVAATAVALRLTVLGSGSVSVYDGSLSEWAADPELPLVTAA